MLIQQGARFPRRCASLPLCVRRKPEVPVDGAHFLQWVFLAWLSNTPEPLSKANPLKLQIAQFPFRLRAQNSIMLKLVS